MTEKELKDYLSNNLKIKIERYDKTYDGSGIKVSVLVNETEVSSSTLILEPYTEYNDD